MRLLVMSIVILALAGCGFVARDVGYAGAHPGYMRFSCDDSGGAYVQLQGNIAALMYGSNNAASVTCKGKITVEQGKGPAPALPEPPAKP